MPSNLEIHSTTGVAGQAACAGCLQKVCQERPTTPNCHYAVGDACKVPMDCPLEVPKAEWQSPFFLSQLPRNFKEPLAANANAMNSRFLPWDPPSIRIRHYLQTGVLRLISLDPQKISNLGAGRSSETQLAGGGGNGGGSTKKNEAAANDVAPEAVVEAKRYSLENPRWAKAPAEGEAAGKEVTTESASPNNVVLLMVDTVDLSPGDNVIFSVFKADDNAKVATLSGQVGYKRPDNAAVVRWVVPEEFSAKNCAAEKMEFKFVAKFSSKNLEEKSKILKVERKFRGSV